MNSESQNTSFTLSKASMVQQISVTIQLLLHRTRSLQGYQLVQFVLIIAFASVFIWQVACFSQNRGETIVANASIPDSLQQTLISEALGSQTTVAVNQDAKHRIPSPEDVFQEITRFFVGPLGTLLCVLYIIIGLSISFTRRSFIPLMCSAAMCGVMYSGPQLLESYVLDSVGGGKSGGQVELAAEALAATLSVDGIDLATKWARLKTGEAENVLKHLNDAQSFTVLERILELVDDSPSKRWMNALLAYKQGHLQDGRLYYQSLDQVPDDVTDNEFWALGKVLGVKNRSSKSADIERSLEGHRVLACWLGVVLGALLLLGLGTAIAVAALRNNASNLEAWIKTQSELVT